MQDIETIGRLISLKKKGIENNNELIKSKDNNAVRKFFLKEEIRVLEFEIGMLEWVLSEDPIDE